MYEIDKEWLEQRLREYQKAREAVMSAWITRHQQVIAKLNDGVEPTIGRNFNGEFTGLHAPHDGYIHEWFEGEKVLQKQYMGGQFLPIDKQSESMYEGSLGEVREHCFTYVPVDRFVEVEAALNEVQDRFERNHTGGRPIFCQVRSGQIFTDRDGERVCYVYLSKTTQDVADHVRVALLGEIEDAEEAAAKVQEIADLARQERYDSAPAIAPGRQAFAGEVLATKWKDTDYGPVYKMLVQDDRGFKLWGSVPKNIDPGRGERVAFMATVTPSNDDPKFGFFKRPTKAIMLDEEEVA